jgi:aminoglycoside/choline kinase family phosphotransferase
MEPKDPASNMKTDDRLGQLTEWVRQFEGLSDADPQPASEDASFRRYFRVQGTESHIVMDAPPPQEDCRPFVAIAGYLESMGLNSTHVLQADLDRGFLLLTDLGADQYLDVIGSKPDAADSLYRDALDALLVIQGRGAEIQQKLPPYDEEMMRFEISLFREWLCEKHLGLEITADDDRCWKETCDSLVSSALVLKNTFVHRDYHSRNLIVIPGNNPGILDFQDAVEGPYTYDLVSLLKDCYVKWPASVIEERAMYFYEKLPESPGDAKSFLRDFDLMGVQRHLKAAGIFARLLHRDGKTGYLKDVPRTLSYIVDIAPKYEELRFLGDLIAGRVLPALEQMN